MSDSGIHPKQPEGKLADAVREVKNWIADRDDVVVEMREASRMRLELLAQELQPVFDETPKDLEQFDFAISSGLQPRLWIDATAHVAMGRDRRVYRFVRDTRLGRVVLAESVEMKTVAARVIRYVAERLIERQRMLEGEAHPAAYAVAEASAPVAQAERPTGAEHLPEDRTAKVFSALTYILIGALAGAGGILAWLWDKIPPAVMP
jgi:hypothetical protein